MIVNMKNIMLSIALAVIFTLCIVNVASAAQQGRRLAADLYSSEEGTTLPPIVDCLECNIDYYGHDIESFEDVDDAITCQELCVENPMCEFWTYALDLKNCYLKDARSGRMASENRISGKKECCVSGSLECCDTLVEWEGVCDDADTTTSSTVDPDDTSTSTTVPPETTDCWECNVDYYGNDVDSVENVESVEECQAACQGNDDCDFFTYIVSSKVCWLKHSKAGRQDSSDRVSGAKECCMPGSIDCHDTVYTWEGQCNV